MRAMREGRASFCLLAGRGGVYPRGKSSPTRDYQKNHSLAIHLTGIPSALVRLLTHAFFRLSARAAVLL